MKRGQASGQAAIIAWLADPATHGGGAVERIDTHGNILFLVGDRVLKLKRAIRYPYMDFSTLERRKAACRAEVTLNRRTAPLLYLGTLPIRQDAAGRLSFGARESDPDDAVDWVVEMKRFDQGGLLDRLAAAGPLDRRLLAELAEEIAGFHASAEPVATDEAAASIRRVVEGNIEALEAQPQEFAAAKVARLAALSRTACDRLAPLMDRRAAEGRVRLCHGDLHLGNICRIEGRPILFDGIEFNPDFTRIDPLYDLAFLLMDLDHRADRAGANLVFNRYLEMSGDYGGVALLPLFQSVRAAIRAKTAADAARVQTDEGAAASLRSNAHAYLDQATRLLEPQAARLIAISGLSGTGKTTLARLLAPSLGPAPGAVVLRSDFIRKQLQGKPETERLDAAGYTPAVSRRVYETLRQRARIVLDGGFTAIADATFLHRAERADIATAAGSAGFAGFWLEAPETLLAARVTARRGDASDATAAVVQKQQRVDTGPIDWTRLDSTRPTQDLAAEAALRRL